MPKCRVSCDLVTATLSGIIQATDLADAIEQFQKLDRTKIYEEPEERLENFRVEIIDEPKKNIKKVANKKVPLYKKHDAYLLTIAYGDTESEVQLVKDLINLANKRKFYFQFISSNDLGNEDVDIQGYASFFIVYSNKKLTQSIAIKIVIELLNEVV